MAIQIAHEVEDALVFRWRRRHRHFRSAVGILCGGNQPFPVPFLQNLRENPFSWLSRGAIRVLVSNQCPQDMYNREFRRQESRVNFLDR